MVSERAKSLNEERKRRRRTKEENVDLYGDFPAESCPPPVCKGGSISWKSGFVREIGDGRFDKSGKKTVAPSPTSCSLASKASDQVHPVL